MTPCLLTLLALSVGAPRPKDPPVPSPVGHWEVLSWTYAGNNNSVTPGTTHEYTSDGKRIVHEPGEEVDNGRTFARRPTDGPRAIDLYRPDGNGGTEHFKAIYKIEGNEMWLCVGTSETRPTKFESLAGTQLHLYKFRRVGKKD